MYVAPILINRRTIVTFIQWLDATTLEKLHYTIWLNPETQSYTLNTGHKNLMTILHEMHGSW